MNSAAPTPLPAGSQLGKWVVRSQIGSGSFGHVYEVSRPALPDQTRALKTVKYGENADAELAVLSELDHPLLLRVVSVIGSRDGIPPGQVGIVMEQGQQSLGSYLEKNGRLTEAEFRTVAADIAAALAYLHDHRGERGSAVIHGDLKPDNVVSVGDLWKIGDFGTSALTGTAEGVIRGFTPAYAPPEVHLADHHRRPIVVGPEADSYCFGALAHVCLLGATPQSEEPGSFRDTDLSFEARSLLTACLSQVPEQRPTGSDLYGLVDKLARPPRRRTPGQDINEMLDRTGGAATYAGAREFARQTSRLTPAGETSHFYQEAFNEFIDSGDQTNACRLIDAIDSVRGAAIFWDYPGLFEEPVDEDTLAGMARLLS